MRSSKSRSRSKQNRPRSIGNIVNRVFDSSGPEGKVRGTPQQIIEKYQTLARDAQLSNDRVAAENFLQHAEHYTRMLGEAMRELAAEQENRRQQQGGNGNGNGPHGQERPPYATRRDEREEEQPEVAAPAFGLVETGDEGDSGLVETPEARSEQPRGEQRPPRNERRPDAPRRDREDRRRDDRRRDDRRPVEAAEPAPQPPEPQPEAAPEPKPKPARAPRAERPAPEPAAPAADGPAAEVAEKPKRARAPRKPRTVPDGNSEAAE